MKATHWKQNSCAVLAALIWGTGFVAQSLGADHLQAFTFNALRSLIAAVLLALLCLSRRRKNPAPAQPGYRKDLLLGGICCGAAMCLGANLQQLGIETVSAGKAGFLTALYIILVPILGIFLRRKAPWTVWLAVVVAVAGLYFLCVKEDGFAALAVGDVYLLLCALCYAVQILCIDHFGAKVDGVELSCVQMAAVTLFSALGMLAWESPSWEAIHLSLGPLLYAGIMSSGVGYTLQILAQKDSNPTVISLLLSLESVFATLSGALILGDRMSGREYLGCALMFAAVILAQLPAGKRAGKTAA